jgi:hypothetical protein
MNRVEIFSAGEEYDLFDEQNRQRGREGSLLYGVCQAGQARLKDQVHKIKITLKTKM